MARRDHDQEKKRRRQKRLQKHQRAERHQERPGRTLEEMIQALTRQLKVPQPATWPGAADPSLGRPDQIKFELGQFAAHQEPGKSKYRHLKQAAARGILAAVPALMEDWLIEEFFWHGVPGDPWQPVDAFLEQAGDRFPPRAREQLRLWKAARLAVFEIGAVHDDVMDLQEWDLIRAAVSGPPLRAITLNIGGVNIFRDAGGQLLLTYLAPWAPADNLFCGLGYALTPTKANAAVLAPYLGLRHADAVARPLPWKETPAAGRGYLKEWRTREWHSWLAAHLQFPFHALVITPRSGKLALRQVTELVPSTPEYTHKFGVYLAVPDGDTMVVTGATKVGPLDVTSPTALALAEYQAYREMAGPPPETVGRPDFLTLR
jgi:hypothetical protein